MVPFSMPFSYLVLVLTNIIFLSAVRLPSLETLEKVSFEVTNRTLHQKQSFTVKGEIFYKINTGMLITHYHYPKKNIVFTNAKGEMKIYNPEKNEVAVKQDQLYSSEGNFVTFFFNGKSKDMGLENAGFIPGKSSFEKDLEIKEYYPAQTDNGKISKASLVSKKFIPVYISFFDKDNKIIKKTYFTDYTKISSVNFPLKITEITYVAEKDSVISQQIFSNIKSNSSVDDRLFQFQIPASAKLIH